LCCSLLIVVGQRLWFRLHVRCSFYHSIHKDNGGQSGTRSQVKKIKLKDLERKDYRMGPTHSCNHFILPLPFAFSSSPLLFNFGIPISSIPTLPLLFPLCFSFFSQSMDLIRAFTFCFA